MKWGDTKRSQATGGARLLPTESSSAEKISAELGGRGAHLPACVDRPGQESNHLRVAFRLLVNSTALVAAVAESVAHLRNVVVGREFLAYQAHFASNQDPFSLVLTE